VTAWERLVAIVGDDAARLLQREFGGRRLTIPPEGSHSAGLLVVLVGHRALAEIRAACPRQVSVPRAPLPARGLDQRCEEIHL
jgi:hypothetical protein